LKSDLENNFGIVSYKLEKFCDDDQIEYLLKYWKPTNENKQEIIKKAKCLLNRVNNSINDRERDLTGIPLQLKMLAEIYFDKDFPKRPTQELILGTLGVSAVEPPLIIPPNKISKYYSHLLIKEDISLLTLNPHMHLIGKSFKAWALTPDQDTIRLISIPRWDFRWQYFYTFPQPVKIPKGSTIWAEGVFDNTEKNPNNPYSPPQEIREREGSMKTTDEMFQFILTYIPYQTGDENISVKGD
jgi:hypothetical protein